ncbi:MAG: hypothetical protein A3C36_06295 [Omnitrophica WOR_2 bacterium RIFCSPHIGHO2_02_FULL_52_10]|nr:MAG: hypothetical protein A3C36_06295 [Omnitrophica WOR_2 bacterium RIFCSPHIGHO2_02_FULL_52_10]
MNTLKYHKNALAALFGIILCFCLILFAEVCLWAIDRLTQDNRQQLDRVYAQDYRQTDENGIPMAKTGSHRSFLKNMDTGEYIYDVNYTIDEFGRRVTIVPGREQRDQYILFMGCSFMYGEGVQDNETLPFHVGRMTTEYLPYNYAFHGLGPFDLLAKLENLDLRSQVQEKDGLLIYLFMDDHVKRVTGAMSVMKWKGNQVYYAVDHQGDFVRHGSFNTGRSFLTPLYKILLKSRILRYFNVDIPKIGTSHIELTAKVIEAMKNEYQKKFGSEKFYVFIKSKSWIGQRLAEQLDARGIKNFNIESIFADGDRELYRLSADDGHPSALAQQMMAEKIVQDLQLQ